MSYLDELIITFTNPIISDAIVSKSMAKELTTLDANILIKKLFENNVDILFLENVKNPEFASILAWCDESYKKTVKTMQTVNEQFVSHGIDYLLFKSFPSFRQHKDDVDVFVPNLQMYLHAQEVLTHEHFSKTHSFEKECHFDKKDNTQIDLHMDISWDFLGRGGSGPQLLDLNHLWTQRRTVTQYGIQVNVPCVEDEVLVVTAHAIFQHSYLTLGEILYIGELLRLQSIDYTYILDVCRRYGWEQSLILALSIVSSFYKTFWYIDIVLPSAFKPVSVGTFPVYQVFPFFVPQSKNKLINWVQHFFRVGVYLYRYLYYFKYKESLCFNKVPKEVL